ncbi:MAG: O-antigen ligase family protein [Chloroflexaceae bacterium]|nr:O-antigen ligase family protein [Chloroflexaceae bacterium]
MRNSVWQGKSRPFWRAGVCWLAGAEAWLVVLAVAASVASERFLLPALVVAGCFWPVRWLASGRPTMRTPLDIPIALLVLLLPVTLWATAWPEITVPQVYRLLTGIGVYYALVNWAATPGRLRLLLVGTVLSSLFLALAVPFVIRWVPAKFPFLPASLHESLTVRLADTIHPNVMAGQLVVLLPFPLALALFAWRATGWRTGLLLSATALSMMGLLVLTQSRGALLALVAVLILMAVLRWRYGLVLLPLVAVILLIGWLFVGPGRLLEALATEQSLGSFAGRLEIWSRSVAIIRDFPFTGVGMGGFGPMCDILAPLFLHEPGTIPHAHNLFLQVAVDLGIPGLLLWLAALLLIARTAWGVYCAGQAMGDGWWSGVGAGLVGSQAALATHGLFDAVTWGWCVRPHWYGDYGD